MVASHWDPKCMLIFMNYTVQSLMKFILVFWSQTHLPILKLIESRLNIANRYDVVYQPASYPLVIPTEFQAVKVMSEYYFEKGN